MQAPAYRDWVVKAFNDDMPYDRFLLLQVAADQVAPGDRPALAAMGFLTIGRRFLGVTRDIIDDRIDVLTRGTMGLTVGCARCHDHKFDPIPTERLLLPLRRLPELHRADGADRRPRRARRVDRGIPQGAGQAARGPAGRARVEPGRGVPAGPRAGGRLPDGPAGLAGVPGGGLRRRRRQGRPGPGLRPPLEGLPGRRGEGRRPGLPPLATVRRAPGRRVRRPRRRGDPGFARPDRPD